MGNLIELFYNIRAYMQNQINNDLDLTLSGPDADGWFTIHIIDDDLEYDVRLRSAGEFKDQPMVEIELDRYSEGFREYVQASDHVIARLLYT